MKKSVLSNINEKVELDSVCREYKKLREERRSTGNFIYYTSLVASVFLFILAIFRTNLLVFILGSLFLIFTFIYRYYRVNHASKQLKTKIITAILKNTYKEANYEPFSSLELSEVTNSTMIKKSASFKSTDLISGVYRKNNFLVSDLFLEEGHKYKDSYGKKRVLYEPFYKGTFIKIDLLENTSLILKAYQRSEEEYFIPKDSNLKEVETHSRVFNEKFKIVTSNEIIAQKYITDDLINVLLKYDSIFKGKVSFGLVESKLYVLVNHVNALNIRANKPFNDKQLNQIIDLISLPKNLIKELELGISKYSI